MPITTDRTINIRSSGSFDIGISKSLTSYTFDDLWESAYAGVTATDLKHICDTYSSTAIGKGHDGQSPLNYRSENWNYVYVDTGTMEYQRPEGYYCKVILLYSNTYHQKSFTRFDNGVYVVTSCNMKNLVYTAQGEIYNRTPSFPRRPDFGNIKHINDARTEANSLNGYIIPALLIKYNDAGYVYAILQKDNTASYDYSMSMMNPASVQGYEWGEQMLPFDGDSSKGVAHGFNVNFPNGEFSTTSVYRFDDKHVNEDENILTYIQSTPGGHGGIIYRADTIDKFNEWLSYFGMMFFSDNFYKPIIKDGIITGYTDDLTTESEFDTYTGNTIHDIPDSPIPPVPPTPGGDDIDDMLLGYEGYENGFIKHYEVTAGNLQTISEKMAEDTEHLNAINNIVSLKSYVIPTNQFIAAAVSDRIMISGIDTTVTAPRITVTKSDYEIGSTVVNGKYGTAAEPHFLDFAPYTQIECYIPFCGAVQLPDWVMYKTIHVILISDIIAGSCKGVVKCNGNIVAERVGVLGIDAPFTSEANALKNSAMLQTVLNGANIGMQTLSSGASGNYAGISKNTLQGLANIQQSILAGNNNYTVSVGTAPDKIEYAMPSACYIKVYSPVKEESENYLHTVGKPLMKKKTLSEVSGFTVCSNVDTDGIAGATASERDKIKSLLETGIII